MNQHDEEDPAKNCFRRPSTGEKRARNKVTARKSVLTKRFKSEESRLNEETSKDREAPLYDGVSVNIWDIISELPCFKYARNQYILHQSGTELKSFDNPEEIKFFLLENGIPDASQLDNDDLETLTASVLAAGIDFQKVNDARNNINCLSKENLRIPMDKKEINDLLCSFGFTFENNNIYAPGIIPTNDVDSLRHENDYFNTLDEVRAFVRKARELSSSSRRRLCSRTGSDEMKKKMLSLRIWGATSNHIPLPRFSWKAFQKTSAVNDACSDDEGGSVESLSVLRKLGTRAQGSLREEENTQKLLALPKQEDSHRDEAVAVKVEDTEYDQQESKKATSLKDLEAEVESLRERKKVVNLERDELLKEMGNLGKHVPNVPNGKLMRDANANKMSLRELKAKVKSLRVRAKSSLLEKVNRLECDLGQSETTNEGHTVETLEKMFLLLKEKAALKLYLDKHE